MNTDALIQAKEISYKRRSLEEHGKETSTQLLASHRIEMMRLKEDLEEECRQKTGHDFYDRQLCTTVMISRLPGKSSIVRECRWCHAVDFPENAIVVPLSTLEPESKNDVVADCPSPCSNLIGKPDKMEDMMAMLCRIGYPRRGSSDESANIQSFADEIQARWSLEELIPGD